jgi:hypothetical protein
MGEAKESIKVEVLPRDEDGFRSLPAPGTAARIWFLTIEHMTIQRMRHVGIVVDDLAAATDFFVELGLVLQGEGPVEGRWVDRVVGFEGVRADIAMSTPWLPACEPAALNSSASWSAPRTATGSAMPADRRESSSS